ncbi:phage major tail protein, TP901-1 family [Xanthobacter sp. VNH20]|uniref:phage major tail protein, TP901-1 family n=1 Tax=Xanthobacter sp. VNH20 TaxID=3156616 RepID=UPI0032B399A7
MAAQKGKDLLLKMHDGTSYVTVAGLRSRTLAFNAQSVDVTHSDSAGRWRELLAGAGVKRASIAGSGVFKDAASDALVRAAFFDGTLRDCQVLIPDFGIVSGPFQVTALEVAAEHDREVTFDLTLESAGEITFAAL